MTNLHEISRQIRTTNEANGFDAPDWNRLLTKLMLVVTELDEAVAAVKGDGADPLAEELADATIRLLDILVAIWPDQWSDRRDKPVRTTCFQPIETLLWPALRMVCAAAEYWRYEKRQDVKIALELAVRELFRLAGRLDIDLMAEMESKVQRNAQRGHLHGKARADG